MLNGSNVQPLDVGVVVSSNSRQSTVDSVCNDLSRTNANVRILIVPKKQLSISRMLTQYRDYRLLAKSIADVTSVTFVQKYHLRYQ